MNKTKKAIFGVLGAGVIMFSLAACSTAETPAPVSPGASEEETTPTPVATLDALGGIDTQVALDAGFVDAITSLGLTPGVTGSAMLTEGVLSFPITGGNVDYYDPAEDYRPYVQGSIAHEGSGITLTAGETIVGLSDFVIDPGTSRLTGTVTVNGEVIGEDVFIFNLDGSTLNPLESGPNGEAILEGTTVLISEDAASLLNDTFGTDAVTSDLVVGIAKITAVPAE